MQTTSSQSWSNNLLLQISKMECKVTYLPFIFIAIHTNTDGILIKESKSVVSGNNFYMHLNSQNQEFHFNSKYCTM